MRCQPVIVLLAAVVTLAACDLQQGSENSTEVQRVGDEIFIIDRTGKKWNVTHAVNAYGFKAEEFQFGLGPFAIKPLIAGELGKIYGKGDKHYPEDDSEIPVMGVVIAGEARAYPLSMMERQEVANETFGTLPVHVAVAY